MPRPVWDFSSDEDQYEETDSGWRERLQFDNQPSSNRHVNADGHRNMRLFLPARWQTLLTRLAKKHGFPHRSGFVGLLVAEYLAETEGEDLENLLRELFPYGMNYRRRCVRGHLLVPDNVVMWGKYRQCKTCRLAVEAKRERDWGKFYRARRERLQGLDTTGSAESPGTAVPSSE